jgi:hypothetical protein
MTTLARRGASRVRGTLASRRSTVAIFGRGPRFLLRHILRIRAASSSQPGRSAWRAGPRASRGIRLRAAAAGRHALLRLQDRLRRRPSMSKADLIFTPVSFRSQYLNSNRNEILFEAGASRWISDVVWRKRSFASRRMRSCSWSFIFLLGTMLAQSPRPLYASCGTAVVGLRAEAPAQQKGQAPGRANPTYKVRAPFTPPRCRPGGGGCGTRRNARARNSPRSSPRSPKASPPESGGGANSRR